MAKNTFVAEVTIKHCPELQSCAISKKTNDANLRKWWKTKFQVQFSAPKIFLLILTLLIELVPSYRYMQFKEKLMNHTWENGIKPNFTSNFDPFGPNLGSRNFCHRFYFY